MALIALVATTDDDRSVFSDTLDRLIREHSGTATSVIAVEPTQSADNHVPSRQDDGLIARPTHVSQWRPLYAKVGAESDAQRRAVKDLLKQGSQSVATLRAAVNGTPVATPATPATPVAEANGLVEQMAALMRQAGLSVPSDVAAAPAPSADVEVMPESAHSLTPAARDALATWANVTLAHEGRKTAIKQYVAGQVTFSQALTAWGDKADKARKSALRVIKTHA